MNDKLEINIYCPLKELSVLCEKFDIRKSNFSSKREDFQQLIREYFQSNPEFNKHKSVILNGLKSFLK
jgi:hypothetical protein